MHEHRTTRSKKSKPALEADLSTSVDPIIEAYRRYKARGWKPIPLARGAKKLRIEDWQKREFLEQSFRGRNIGLQYGPPSKDLGDVDLDCSEAIELAPKLLPPTLSKFGRASKPVSHWQYYIDGVPADERAFIQYKDDADKVLLELRLGSGGKGAQSMCPPSVHPSGETVEWHEDGEPARVPYVAIARATQLLAAACLFLRHWPREASHRHDLAMRVGGFLKRVGLTNDEVDRLVAAVCEAAGDEEDEDRRVGAYDATLYGFPALAEVFGQDVAAAIARILGFAHAAETEVAELNEGFAYIVAGGKSAVMAFDGKKFELWKPEAFKLWHANKKMI